MQRSFRTALHAVADALTAHGFAAHAERHGDGLRIVSDHCPFGGAAIEHPVICAVDRGLVRGMLGALYGQTDASTSQSRPMGDDQCITDLSSSEAELARRTDVRPAARSSVLGGEAARKGAAPRIPPAASPHGSR